jgi:hypothetical protein
MNMLLTETGLLNYNVTKMKTARNIPSIFLRCQKTLLIIQKKMKNEKKHFSTQCRWALFQ